MTTTRQGSSDADAAEARLVDLQVERFDFSRGLAQMTGDRGTRITAATRFVNGRVFSTHFPEVYVADNGDVELGGDLRVPAADALAWLRAVVDHVEARQDAS